MLVDIEFALDARLERAKAFFAPHYGEKGYPRDERSVMATFGHHTVKPGVYVTSLNGNLAFDDMIDRERECESREWIFKTTYGVADDPDQAVAFLESEALGCPHVILLTPIFREHQPERDGWRWEKWGPYVGTRKPQADYLADEPEIDRVFVFQAHPIDLVKYEAARADTASAAEEATAPAPGP